MTMCAQQELLVEAGYDAPKWHVIEKVLELVAEKMREHLILQCMHTASLALCLVPKHLSRQTHGSRSISLREESR